MLNGCLDCLLVEWFNSIRFNLYLHRMQYRPDPKIDTIIKKYPEAVQLKLRVLRQLIIDTAKTMDEFETLEESLKWGEPSFTTKVGSTLRFDWKEKSPEQYALYFSCSSRLVPTFRIAFNHILEFEGNRAIILPIDEDLPQDTIVQCIKAALHYHKVKDDMMLGIKGD